MRAIKTESVAIAVLSESKLFRDGIVAILRRAKVGDILSYSTAAQLLEAAKRGALDVALVDGHHPRQEMKETITALQSSVRPTPVLLLGRSDVPLDAVADTSLQFFDDDANHLIDALRILVGGDQRVRRSRAKGDLTLRQSQVMELLASGADNLKMSAHLGISERAVKSHITALLDRFHVENRTELALLAWRAGFGPRD